MKFLDFFQSEMNAQDGGSGKFCESEFGEDGGGSMDARGSYKKFNDGRPVGFATTIFCWRWCNWECI